MRIWERNLVILLTGLYHYLGFECFSTPWILHQSPPLGERDSKWQGVGKFKIYYFDLNYNVFDLCWRSWKNFFINSHWKSIKSWFLWLRWFDIWKKVFDQAFCLRLIKSYAQIIHIKVVKEDASYSRLNVSIHQQKTRNEINFRDVKPSSSKKLKCCTLFQGEFVKKGITNKKGVLRA